jgi:hypothetical protein
MKAKEIFEKSVKVMKEILTSEGMKASIQRVKNRTEEENLGLLIKERENINELVRKIAEDHDKELLQSLPNELLDAMVLRYLKNRDIFMKTFPEGINDINPDPFSLWAAIMISPQDDKPILWS